MFCLQVYLYTVCTPGAQEGKKRMSDTLELQLQTVVSYHVGVKDKVWVPCKSSYCFQLVTHLSTPSL